MSTVLKSKNCEQLIHKWDYGDLRLLGNTYRHHSSTSDFKTAYNITLFNHVVVAVLHLLRVGGVVGVGLRLQKRTLGMPTVVFSK